MSNIGYEIEYDEISHGKSIYGLSELNEDKLYDGLLILMSELNLTIADVRGVILEVIYKDIETEYSDYIEIDKPFIRDKERFYLGLGKKMKENNKRLNNERLKGFIIQNILLS